ncbi:Ig-like domain-containing protein [uncultured Oscillibacter sp.]|uniref:Ig-like domain-containing protein n=1 Tax=uncultured Oscillibacter sp. TaxID=876091 RepID=UPI00262B879D|nr:Ig-like domain-containing protein [uncultured Oscillibacter sp.]
MKHQLTRAAALLALTAVLLTGSASALFGKKAEEASPEGAPQVWDLEIRTYRGIPGQGQFLASDPEGDEMTFALADEPRKGVAVIEGDGFTYTPDEGATGTDHFTYTATDSQGHVSAPAKVTVTIDKTRSGVNYADTKDSPAARAAQTLAEKGVFTGGKIGDSYYFQPDQPVSRSEFLAMALETAGRKVTGVTMTGFCDDPVIPTWAKAYAAAGAADGIIRGISTAEGVAFRGDETVTFNEAATILDRVLDLGDVDLDVWYADRSAAPSWAAQAVGNMEAVSVLSAGSFGSQSMEQAVTRADAAQMLEAAGILLEGGEESRGFFSWLA